MTAPHAPRTPRAAPLAGADIVARAFRAEHDTLDHLFWFHVEGCVACEDGLYCPIGDGLASRADRAGLRWQEAERRARRGQP